MNPSRPISYNNTMPAESASSASLLSGMATSSHPLAGSTVTTALDQAFSMLMDERVGQFRMIFEEVDKRFIAMGDTVAQLEQEKAGLKAAFEAEVDQRHYEMGQVNAVLKQLEGLFGQVRVRAFTRLSIASPQTIKPITVVAPFPRAPLAATSGA